MSAKGDVNLSISGDDAGLIAALGSATKAVGENVDAIKEKLASVGEGFSSLKEGFIGLAAVMAGGEIGQQLNEVAERAEQISITARNFNMTAVSLQGLQAAAAQTGVDSGTLSTAMVTLQSRMAQAAETGGSSAERFTSLGITLKEMRDPTFSVVDALAKMGAGANSNAALMGVLGARGASLIPLMRELAQNHNLVADSAQRVGALTETEIGQLEAYKDQIAVTGIQWDNFKTRLLGELVPAMSAAMESFSGVMDSATKTTQALSPLQEAIEYVWRTLLSVREIVQDVTVVIAATVSMGVDGFGALGSAIDDAFHRKFGAAKNDMKEGAASIKADWTEMFDSFQRNAADADAKYRAFQKTVETPLAVPPAPPAVKTNILPDLSHTKSLADQMDQEFQRLGERLQSTMERAQQQITATTAAGVTVRESLETAGIDRQIAAVQSAYKSGQISVQQDLQQTQALLAQKWAEQQSYVDRLRTLYAGNQAELDRLDAQEGKDHTTYLGKMQSAQDSYSAKVTQSWQSVASSISNEMTRAFTGVLQGTESLSQATQRMFANMAEGITTTLVKMEATKAVMHALGIQQNKEEEKSNAAVAASGAAKSAANIPIIGWILAPIAAAATYAMASGFSAKEGFDIPHGLNPQVQLHSREMVLPEQYANVIRGMAGGEGGGGDTHHWHIHAADASSFADMLDRNEGGFREKLAAAVRGRPVWGH